ncbi:MAG: efflux RND transporter periplasmic adaptor subunit [Aureliella sp.]
MADTNSHSSAKVGSFRPWGALFVGGLVLAGLLAAGRAWVKPRADKLDLDQLMTHTVRRESLRVSVTEQGTLESSENTEIKCKVRGENTVISVVENGSEVKEGDVLVRLDTLTIEDQINERSKYAYWSQSGADSAEANARRAKLAISQYLEGTFVAELKTMKKDLAIAESNLRTAQNMLRHSRAMFDKGYVSALDVQEKEFAVTQSELNVSVQNSQIEVLQTFTKAEKLAELEGNLKAAEANRDSLVERAKMDGTRRDLAQAELELCVIKAPKDGMVIYPSAQAWENKPDVEEGATVFRDQVLLLMPDLKNMQVKVGVHESMVERVGVGLQCNIELPELTLEGEVTEVASVARPAGWWTGNVVKYDTIVSLPEAPNLRPGMSAEVEIVLADYLDVLTVPVSAVIETETETLCWVKKEDSVERRVIKLGDNNDIYIIVEQGLKEGEEVVLNPRESIEEARQEVLNTIDESEPESVTGDSPKDGAAKSTAEKTARSNLEPESETDSSESTSDERVESIEEEAGEENSSASATGAGD